MIPSSTITKIGLAVIGTTLTLSTFASSPEEQTQAAELAKELQNPIANLIQVPIQNNSDYGFGPDNAVRYTANIQPVIPFSISEDWNLVTRTIVPIIFMQSPIKGAPDTGGLGDITQSFFFSPKDPTENGWIWGAGPVFLWPSATDDTLGSGKWGAGPTVVLLKQTGPWTYGGLANHIESFAGWGDKEVSRTFLQPFLNYTTKTFTSFGINTESSYDWQASQWTVPVNLTVSQLLKIGKQPISIGMGLRYYTYGATGGPEWGLRLGITFLFPK